VSKTRNAVYGVLISLSLASLALGCGGSATDREGGRLTPDQVYQAAGSGDLEMMMIGLENDVLRVDDQDAQGRTLLHHAAAGNQFNIVNWLIEDYQANPNLADEQGRTPLDYARENQNSQLAFMLERAAGAP
jgi:hypothetical protein